MQERYVRPQIPKEIDAEYKRALSGIPRWVGGLVESKKSESNLEHVESLYALVDEVRGEYPILDAGLDWDAVDDMIYLHDAGEIISGDLVRSRPDYDEVKYRWKRGERAAFRYLTRRYIHDPTLKQQARDTYERYTAYGNDDVEALFVHLLDKVQAVRFGLKYVYNKSISPEDPSRTQATMSANLILEFAEALLAAVSGDTKNEISSFVHSELERYVECGYPELAEESIRRLFSKKVPT